MIWKHYVYISSCKIKFMTISTACKETTITMILFWDSNINDCLIWCDSVWWKYKNRKWKWMNWKCSVVVMTYIRYFWLDVDLMCCSFVCLVTGLSFFVFIKHRMTDIIATVCFVLVFFFFFCYIGNLKKQIQFIVKAPCVTEIHHPTQQNKYLVYFQYSSHEHKSNMKLHWVLFDCVIFIIFYTCIKSWTCN